MSYTILIVEDNENARMFIAEHLLSIGYELCEASNLQEAQKYIDSEKADIVLLDVLLPDGSGLDLLDRIVRLPLRPPIILMTGHGDINMAVEAMKNGAMDFIQKPIDFEILEKSIKQACEVIAMRREIAEYRRSQQQQIPDFIIGNNPKMKYLYELAQRVANSSSSVLITGDTGTGKEVLARAIHQMGPRKNKLFMDIDSGAIQTYVFESELFGHEPGAFTSADKRKLGLMEIADGGILFLDEISSMPLDIQAKLLRALNERSFRRVGGTTTIKVDVQVIAASNRNLNKMMENGLFRDDLFYRLKVIDLHIPPLRERKEDISELVGFFIHKNNPKLGKNIKDVTPRALETLIAHQWPGNIRELNNVIEHAMIFCDDAAIDLPHLPSDLLVNC